MTRGTTTAAAIGLRRVEFRYPGSSFELRIAELEIAAGQAVACIGPSGSGKTTLVNLIAGVVTPASGSVRLFDTLISSLPDAERRALRLARIGMLFQELELLDYLSALDNALLPYLVSTRMPLDAAVRTRAARLLADVGLGDKIRRRPHQLSQGERQRVALCRALVTEPDLLLCDEPTGNLDPHTAGAMLDLLLSQAAARNATLLMVTHDHGVLHRFDRVVDLAELRAAAGGRP